jgi:hypothetical protein
MTSLLDMLPDIRWAGATENGEYGGPCPWCGGTDRFRAWPEHSSGSARWWCRQCERRGDTIDLLRQLGGLTFRAASAVAGQPMGDRRRSAPARRASQPSPLLPPSFVWQRRAEQVAVEAEGRMWSPEGARALAYLRGRGFTVETIRGARLGYVAEDRREIPEAWGLPIDHLQVWVPRGVAIPWRVCGAIWRLNVRRSAGSPKYCGPAGSGNALYGADGIHPNRPVVVVEGELDALAVAQEAGDLVGAVATGSTCGARRGRWIRLLRAAPAVLVSFDGDDPGEQAAGWWLAALPGPGDWCPKAIPLGCSRPAQTSGHG